MTDRDRILAVDFTKIDWKPIDVYLTEEYSVMAMRKLLDQIPVHIKDALEMTSDRYEYLSGRLDTCHKSEDSLDYILENLERLKKENDGVLHQIYVRWIPGWNTWLLIFYAKMSSPKYPLSPELFTLPGCDKYEEAILILKALRTKLDVPCLMQALPECGANLKQ